MRALAARYLNEFVSLTVMALLVVALAAGQADAGSNKTQETPAATAEGDDYGFRHEGE